MVAKLEPAQRITRLTALDAVLARIDELVAPVTPVAWRTGFAVGKILADDLILPTWPKAALALRDGWAVCAALTQDASPYAPVPLPTTSRIEVGAPMPEGTDAIATVDAIVMNEGRAEAVAPVTAGEGVLACGADAGGRSTLVQAGRFLPSLAVAALEAVQIPRVGIRTPRVRVLQARSPGDPIIDAAVALVMSAVVRHGGELAIARHEGLDGALQRTDIDDFVVAIGGTGIGRKDASVAILARYGEIEAHGVAISPGETAAFGMVGARPVLLLPGRLDAAFAAFMLLGRRILARLAASHEEPRRMHGRLTRKITSSLGLAELIPVRQRGDEVEPLAAGYLPLQALAGSDGWILVGADSEGHPAGAAVMVDYW